MVTERCSSANGANIARLLKRCGQEVPQSLQEIVEITTQASLSSKTLKTRFFTHAFFLYFILSPAYIHVQFFYKNKVMPSPYFYCYF